MSTSTANSRLNLNLAYLESVLNRDEEVLRRKVLQLIKKFNHGSTKVSRYGITVDVFVEFERLIDQASPNQVKEALEILRA